MIFLRESEKKMNAKTYAIMNLRGKGHKKIIEDLNLYIEDLLERKDSLATQLREFKQDEEIQKLTKELSDTRSRSLHTMTEKENEEAKAFSAEHWATCKGNMKYILEGTGIGTAVSIQCKKCQTIKDVTDMDNW